MGIFIACTFAEIDVGKVFRSFAPYLVTLVVGLIIITACLGYSGFAENVLQIMIKDRRFVWN